MGIYLTMSIVYATVAIAKTIHSDRSFTKGHMDPSSIVCTLCAYTGLVFCIMSILFLVDALRRNETNEPYQVMMLACVGILSIVFTLICFSYLLVHTALRTAFGL